MADSHRHVFTALVTLLTAILSGMALGALWALLATSVIEHAVWLALGAAAGMALSMRLASPQPGWFAAALAASGTLLATGYAECLQLMMRISSQIGLPLIEVIRTSGLFSTTKLAWRLIPTEHLAIYAIAALLAFVTTVWPRSAQGKAAQHAC